MPVHDVSSCSLISRLGVSSPRHHFTPGAFHSRPAFLFSGHCAHEKAATVNTSLYAAPSYLEKYGTPEVPQDLDNHRIIVYGEQISPMHHANWAQRVGRDDRPPREASLTVNNVIGMVRAAEAGLGVADLPDYMIPENSNLVKVLPGMKGPHFDLYFIYPSDLRRSNRIAAFRDFVTSEISEFRATEND